MPEIKRGSKNVYADLDYQNADEMLIKAKLVSKINEIINARQWTQQQASEVIEIPRPKLSNILNGQFRGVSEAKLMECLVKLGRNVRIVVSEEEFDEKMTSMEVVFA